MPAGVSLYSYTLMLKETVNQYLSIWQISKLRAWGKPQIFLISKPGLFKKFMYLQNDLDMLITQSSYSLLTTLSLILFSVQTAELATLSFLRLVVFQFQTKSPCHIINHKINLIYLFKGSDISKIPINRTKYCSFINLPIF